jgi:hypothetical protein
LARSWPRSAAPLVPGCAITTSTSASPDRTIGSPPPASPRCSTPPRCSRRWSCSSPYRRICKSPDFARNCTTPLGMGSITICSASLQELVVDA